MAQHERIGLPRQGPDALGVGPAGDHLHRRLQARVGAPQLGGHGRAQHHHLAGCRQGAALPGPPEAHQRMATLDHAEGNSNIGVQVIQEQQIGGSSEAMHQPTHQRQIGGFTGKYQQITTPGRAHQSQQAAQTEKNAIDDPTANAGGPPT